jgi:hypothetical protein
MRDVTTSPGEHRPLFSDFEMLTIYAEVDPKVLARGTPGFSGADLQNMVKYGHMYISFDPVLMICTQPSSNTSSKRTFQERDIETF